MSLIQQVRTARGWTVLVGTFILIVIAAISCVSSSAPDTPRPTATSTQALITATAVQPDPTATASNVRPTSTTVQVQPTATTAVIGPGIDVNDIMVELLGGETTVFFSGADAFVFPAANLEQSLLEKIEIGEALFLENWTPPTGLGPLFNATACATCHVNQGRANPSFKSGSPARGLLLKLSVPGPGGPADEPAYGSQLQDDALEEVEAEALFVIRHQEITGQFADGTPYTLMNPAYLIENLAYGPFQPGTMISPRIAPAMIGMGLLEAISAEDLLALADPDDKDGDGISGRINMVPDAATGSIEIGRFGWKAGQPNVEQQVAEAFRSDLGITSPLAREENCTESQTACSNLADIGRTVDLAGDRVANVGFFSRTVAVPAMRGIDNPDVRQGAAIFLSSGCSSCHTPRFETGEHEISELSNQVIFPYTDLLLHDMGDGLADNRPEFLASGREWRTPPLWGIGLIETVNSHTRFLHDGRARSLTEAILWHAGEAEKSRDVFKNLSQEERGALIAFLKAL